MNILFIDDNINLFAIQKKIYANEIQSLAQFLDKYSEYFFSTNVEKIIDHLLYKINQYQKIIIFINIEIKIKNKLRHEFAGIDILKRIRFSSNEGNDIHCVTYSFQSFENLVRTNSENAIIASQGTTFIQLPFDFRKLDLEELMYQKADLSSLRKFIQSDTMIPDERHNWANWYGVKQLWDVHSVVSNRFNDPYPQNIQLRLKEQKTQKATFIYDSVKDYKTLPMDMYEDIYELKEKIHTRKLKMLFIDDQWDIGWSDIFVKMLYSAKELPRKVTDSSVYELKHQYIFRCINPLEYKTDQLLWDKIKNVLDNKVSSIDLILLDLRLKGETNESLDIQSLSGTKILHKIRNAYPGIPIILVSASNKIWTFEQIIQIGADGYWIKEGLDERRTSFQTAENYLRFLQIVEKVTGNKYSSLKDLIDRTNILSQKSKYWWQNFYDGKHKIVVDPKEIFNILFQCLLMFRNFISQYELGYGYQSKQDLSFICSTIVSKLAIIVEIIHGGISSIEILDKRKDQIAKYLMMFRHRASHSKEFSLFGFDDVVFFIRVLLLWLSDKKYTTGLNTASNKFTNHWTNDKNIGEKYKFGQLTRTYISFAWWFSKDIGSSKSIVSHNERTYLRQLLKNILNRHRVIYKEEWDKILKRIHIKTNNKQYVQIDFIKEWTE